MLPGMHNPVARAIVSAQAHRTGVADPPHTHPTNPRTNQRNQAGKQPNAMALINRILGMGGQYHSVTPAVPPSVPVPKGVDPQTWANSMVEAQYGPVIAELHRQQTAATAASRNNMQALNTGYTGLLADEASRGQANAASSAATTADLGNMGTSLVNAFGLQGANPSLQASVGGDVATEQMYSKLLGQSQANADLATQNLTGQQQQGAKAAELGRAAGQQADIGATLASTLGQKGSDLMQYIQDQTGRNQDLQQQTFANKQTRFEDLMARSQFKADQTSTNLKNTMARMNLGIELANLPKDMQERSLKLSGMRADINAQKKSTRLMGTVTPAQKAANAAAKAARQASMTADQQKATQGVLQGVRSIARWPSGAWRVGLEGTWKRVNAAIQTAGLKPGTPAYKAAQRQAAALVGIQLGPKGNPVGRTPYHKPKPKK